MTPNYRYSPLRRGSTNKTEKKKKEKEETEGGNTLATQRFVGTNGQVSLRVPTNHQPEITKLIPRVLCIEVFDRRNFGVTEKQAWRSGIRFASLDYCGRGRPVAMAAD